MAPPCLQPLCRWLVCIKTGMVFPTQSYFRVFRGSNIPRLRVHSCPFVSIRVHSWFKYSQFSFFRVFRVFRGSSIPRLRGPFVSIRVHSRFKYSQFSWSIRVHSCPFVSIRVHSWFKYSQTLWSIRVHSCPFVVQIFPVFVVHLWSIRVHSCPFVVQVFPDFVFSCVSCVSWFKYSQFSCPFVVQTRGIS